MLKATIILTFLILSACSSDKALTESESSAFTLVSEDVNYREYLQPTRPWEVYEAKMCFVSSKDVEFKELEAVSVSAVSLDEAVRNDLFLATNADFGVLSKEKDQFCLIVELATDGATWYESPKTFRLEAKIRNVTTGEEFLIEGTKVFNKEDL